MSASRSALQSAAAAFLSSGGLMAWENESAGRAAALIRGFIAGELDVSALRAAFGASDRGPTPRPATKATALLALSGVLMPNDSIFSLLGAGTSVRGFMRDLAAATADRSVKSIVIVTDSPGGSIRMLPEAAKVMRTARTLKPVVVSVAGLNASAAYWLTSNASAIEATPSASLGAIGVFMQRASIVKLLQKEGIDVEIFSAGKFKGEGHEATAVTAAERTYNQGIVDAAYGEFVADVSAGRHVLAATIRGGFGEGRLVTAKDALKLGMIDTIATVEDTVARAVSAPAALEALQGQRAALAHVVLGPRRGEHARLEIAEHRRALAAAARRVTG